MTWVARIELELDAKDEAEFQQKFDHVMEADCDVAQGRNRWAYTQNEDGLKDPNLGKELTLGLLSIRR